MIVKAPRWPGLSASGTPWKGKFIAAGAATQTGSGGTSVPLPTGWAVNDLLVCFGSFAASPTIATGWTLIAQTQVGAKYRAAWYRRAVSGDAAPTVTGAGIAIIGAWRGVSASASLPDAAGSAWGQNDTTGDALAVSGITTTVANDKVLFLIVDVSGNNGTWSSWASGGGSGPAPAQEFSQYSAGPQMQVACADYTLATAGGTGVCSVSNSLTGYSNLRGLLVALPPAAVSYTASNAGTANVNGDYFVAGTYGSQPCYVNLQGYYLYWHASNSTWCFATSLGGAPAYMSSSITGTWSIGSGASPVPTVVAG